MPPPDELVPERGWPLKDMQVVGGQNQNRVRTLLSILTARSDTGPLIQYKERCFNRPSWQGRIWARDTTTLRRCSSADDCGPDFDLNFAP